MSGIPLGAPLQRGTGPTSSSLRVFDHIPRLREVLAHGGWPGAVYVQVLISHLKAAKERTEFPAHLDELRGGAVYYTIVGPKGAAEVALVGTGEVIAGGNPESGNRLFFTDGAIGERTGHRIERPIWLSHPEDRHGSQQIEVAPRADRTGQGEEGDARVQARHAPQRKPVRTSGHVQEAGHSDRALGGREVTPKELARRKAASERMKAMHAKRRAGGD